MQFRVAHLLVVMLFVAFFGTALALHSALIGSLVVFATWLVYASLGWWAFVDPARRVVIGSALIFGVSYLVMGLFYWGRTPFLIYMSAYVVDALMEPDEFGDRYSTMECAWSLVLAGVGALLGLFRIRSQTNEEKNQD
jgi:hypothetical protein